MPWATFKEGDEFCVYKLNADNEKMGESLGCHPSRDKAQAQVQALYARENPKSLKDVLMSIAWIKNIFEPEKRARANYKDAMLMCLIECHHCIERCEECLEACVTVGGASALLCADLCRQCIDCCQACIDAANQYGMDSAECIAACRKCAKVCSDCAEACLKCATENPVLTEVCSECAEACRMCADACNMAVAPMMKAGARHRKEDQEALDNAHDALVNAGAHCPGAMKFLKQADGSYRWFGWVSNKFRDRDTAKHPKGEIITESAHKEYIEYLDAHPDAAPEWWSWHTPGTARKARADWWDYADGFLLMSGPALESEAKAYAPDETIGMSHGFYTLQRNAKQGLIEKYRTFEVSDLPLDVAANPYTSFEVIQKELAKMFSKEKRAYLVSKLGEDRVKELEGNTEAMGKALETAGVEYKATEEKVTETTATTSTAETVAVQPIVVDEKSVGALVESIKQALNVDGLQAVITELQTQLKEQGALIEALQKSDDEKVAQTIAPKVKPVTWGFQASKAQETRLTEAETAQHKSSKPGWAAEVFSGSNGQAH